MRTPAGHGPGLGRARGGPAVAPPSPPPDESLLAAFHRAAPSPREAAGGLCPASVAAEDLQKKKKKKKCGIEARSPMSRSNAKRQRQGSLLSRRAGAEVTDGAIRLFHAGRAAWVKPWGPPREGQGHGPLPHAAAPVPAASRPFRGRDPAPV